MEVQGTLLEKREDSPAQKMMSYDLEEDKGRLPNTVADSWIQKKAALVNN